MVYYCEEQKKWGEITVLSQSNHQETQTVKATLICFLYFHNRDLYRYKRYITVEGTRIELLLSYCLIADIHAINLWTRTVNFPLRLTDDDKDEYEGGHSCTDVEHESDVVRQLIDIFHIGHKHRWDEEPYGDAHL